MMEPAMHLCIYARPFQPGGTASTNNTAQNILLQIFLGTKALWIIGQKENINTCKTYTPNHFSAIYIPVSKIQR